MSELLNVPTDSESVLSVREAAERTGEPRWRIYGWIRRKSGPRVHRHGRRIYVAAADLKAFMLENKKAFKSRGPQQEGDDARRPLPASEPVTEPTSVVQESLRVCSPVSGEGCGQRELPYRPRMFCDRGMLFVPEWEV